MHEETIGCVKKISDAFRTVSIHLQSMGYIRKFGLHFENL